jgi:hypothetical protein
MAAPTQKIYVAGLDAVRIYELNQSTGLITSSSGVNSGIKVGGPVSFAYEIPAPESIAHPGNNGVRQRTSLPSIEAANGTMDVSRTDAATIALLSNTKVRQFGDVNSIGWATNQQGSEPNVMLVAYNRGKDNGGSAIVSTYVFPQATIIPGSKGKSREQSSHVYTVQPQICKTHPTGLAFIAGTDGFTTAEYIEYQSNHRLTFAAWVATSAQTAFDFDTELPFVTGSGSITVTVDGVLKTYTTDYTADANGITFGTGLTADAIVRVMYEFADAAVDFD